MAEPYYDAFGPAYFEQSVTADLSEVRDRFVALLPAGGAVCDAGCGSGRDARVFAGLGFRVTAFDASRSLVDLARVHTGLPVAHMTFQEMAFLEAFDGIWACATLLHVSAAEEEDVLARFRAALRPGGVWYLCYRVGEGERHDGERFFRYHTEASLRDLLGRFPDLDVLAAWETPDRRPGHPEAWLNVLVRRRPRPSCLPLPLPSRLPFPGSPMKPFRQTLCLHGYAGHPDGSIRKLVEALAATGAGASLGEIVRPDLPFGRNAGAAFGDGLEAMTSRLQTALDLPWGDLAETLVLGLSMGGLLGVLLAQRQAVGAVCALSAPDVLDGRHGVDGTRPVRDLLAVYGTRDDDVLRGRTGLWPSLTPWALDLEGLTHDHDAHHGLLLGAIRGFLEGGPPGEIRRTLAAGE